MADPKHIAPRKEDYGATGNTKKKPPEPEMPSKQPDDNPAAETNVDSNPRNTPHQRDEERAS